MPEQRKARGIFPGKELSEFLVVAWVVRPQGRRGEVAAEILTDFPERFRGLRQAFLEDQSGPPQPIQVENAWEHKGRIILKFSGIDSITQAERLAGRRVLIRRDERMALPSGHYYVWELTGCRVITQREGLEAEIGTVTEVEPTGGVDLLHVARPGGRHREVLIPFAMAICTRIDPQSRTIVIDPPEDLLELND